MKQSGSHGIKVSCFAYMYTEAAIFNKHRLSEPTAFNQQLFSLFLSSFACLLQILILDPLSVDLLACRPHGLVLGLCQRLQQMLLHYIKRYAMLERFHSLLMCAFWPWATTSHPVLSLTWQPWILGAFPKLRGITCQR